jgi:hypothetical protein
MINADLFEKLQLEEWFKKHSAVSEEYFANEPQLAKHQYYKKLLVCNTTQDNLYCSTK